MAVVSIAQLKSYFNRKDKPTEQQYTDLIDTLANSSLNILNSEGVVSSTSGIDLKTTNTTVLYTVPTGKELMITRIIIRAETVSNVTVENTQSIGSNSSSYNNWGNFTSPSATGNFLVFPQPTPTNSKIFTAGETIRAKYTANTATTDIIGIDLVGYLLDV